jgi:hypothetical protein
VDIGSLIIGAFFGFLVCGMLTAAVDRYTQRGETLRCRCDVCEKVFRAPVKERLSH